MIDGWSGATPFRFGQILCERDAAGRFVLCHREDATRHDLANYDDANAATELARFDDLGEYRPLKTAPNLRHGWHLVLARAEDVQLALDLFYPGRLAAFAAWKRDALVTTPLRETLGRQTGMYRVAAKISDADADSLIGNFCRSNGGCLRTILWRRDRTGTVPSSQLPAAKYDPEFDQTGRDEPASPLLCQEACNLVVAAAREVVKAQ